MNTMQAALIRKDLRSITANKQLLVAMISVPIALTVVMAIMPVFFIIIPIMAASFIAASTFVGEKEKRTLEKKNY